MTDIVQPGPLKGPLLWGAGFMLALANFMVVLDMTITNVSVPTIAGALAVAPNQGTWVITSYAVAEAVSVPLTGWLAQRFGAVRVMVAAMLSFGLFSLLCGMAPTLGTLVVLRVLQGLSGGPMMPLSQTLMQTIFPPQQRNTAMGLWSMTTVVGPIAGPLLGGAITENMGWPWIFFINVPTAAACGFLIWRMLNRHETAIRRRPVDFVGLALLVVWVGALQIMLDVGKDQDWFESPLVIGLAVTAAIGFVAFLIWELTDKDPIVDLKVFRSRAFATSTAVMALTFGTFFASIVLVPLWLQTSMGYDATWAGRVMAFQGVLAVVLSPIVAALVSRVDPRILISFGVTLLAAISFWRTGFDTSANFWVIAAPQLAQGCAMPFFFVPLMTLAMSGVPPAQIASAAGLINFTRTLALAFGTSMITTAWENTASADRAQLAGRLNDLPGALDALGRAGMPHDQALAQIDRLFQAQTVMLATNHMFQISAAIFVLAAMTAWIAPRPKPGGGPVAAH